jgi:hypothetical protein
MNRSESWCCPLITRTISFAVAVERRELRLDTAASRSLFWS